MNPYQHYLQTAEAAARHAGSFLRASFLRDDKVVDATMPHDIKLRLDKETQQLITRELAATFPEVAVLGEEGTSGNADAAARWIIDPIDGTVNYYYGIPIFCVCIALEMDGELVMGCVYDPMQDECFCAVRGEEARCNGRVIHVSPRSCMAEAVVFAGHGSHDHSGEAGLRRFAYLSARVRKMRILGSAALSLCYIAAGRFDAYIESSINLWDFAAARVILEAAGGVLEFTPAPGSATRGAVVAWNGHLPLHETLNAINLS